MALPVDLGGNFTGSDKTSPLSSTVILYPCHHKAKVDQAVKNFFTEDSLRYDHQIKCPLCERLITTCYPDSIGGPSIPFPGNRAKFVCISDPHDTDRTFHSTIQTSLFSTMTVEIVYGCQKPFSDRIVLTLRNTDKKSISDLKKYFESHQLFLGSDFDFTHLGWNTIYASGPMLPEIIEILIENNKIPNKDRLELQSMAERHKYDGTAVLDYRNIEASMH